LRQPVLQWTLVTLIACELVCGRALADAPPPDAGPAPKTAPATSLKPTFFVIAEGANSDAGSAMTIGVANEIGKAMKPLLGSGPWIIPQPDWKQADLIEQCHGDPMALGGVVVTFYTGAASHFYLLFQAETQTFSVTAELVSCNRLRGVTSASPTIVGVIAELPGAHGTPWVVRRSQVSIPLISIAGITALLANTKGPSSSSSGAHASTSSSNSTANVSTAAIFGALFSQASLRDIPGYSTPLKLRYGSQHVGVDLVRAIRDLCTTHADLGPGADAEPRDALCTAMGFTLDPAKVAEQQEALDAFEAAERNESAR